MGWLYVFELFTDVVVIDVDVEDFGKFAAVIVLLVDELLLFVLLGDAAVGTLCDPC